MKQITPISIWDNGQIKKGIILNAYAVNVTLGTSAVFYYSIISETNETLAQGNITMDGENYQLWNDDNVAWSFIAYQLNLTIIGDYVSPKSSMVYNDNNLSVSGDTTENIVT